MNKNYKQTYFLSKNISGTSSLNVYLLQYSLYWKVLMGNYKDLKKIWFLIVLNCQRKLVVSTEVLELFSVSMPASPLDSPNASKMHLLPIHLHNQIHLCIQTHIVP